MIIMLHIPLTVCEIVKSNIINIVINNFINLW